MSEFVCLLAGLAAMSLTFLSHYELIIRLRGWIATRAISIRWRILLALYLTMFAHVLAIFTFGIFYVGLLNLGGYGEIKGDDFLSLLDSLYLSAVIYTAVGFGDIAPKGPIRILAGIEALTGLTMIAVSASMVFFEMGKVLKPRESSEEI